MSVLIHHWATSMLVLTRVILALWVSWAWGQGRACDPPRIPNGDYSPGRTKYALEDEITYQCRDGFYPSTRGTRAKCTPTGWDPPPRCSLNPCDVPEIKHGVLHKEDTYRSYFPVALDQWFHYSCDDQYVTPTQAYWYYVTCTKAGWTPAVPCRRKCVFNYLEHGCSPCQEKSYFQGDSIKVTCHPGYSLPNRQVTMTCTEHGWSPPPRCLRVEHCEMPVFENAIAVITGKPFRPNDKLDYECLEGYENTDGSIAGSMVCGEAGWSHLPTCYNSPKKCGPPPEISNGNITSFPLEVYPPLSQVEYQCDLYYELQGPKYVTCTNGKWSEPPRCIDPCVITEENMNKDNIQLKWRDNKIHFAKRGEVIEFICKSGHSAVTSAQSFQALCGEEGVKLPRCE